MLMKNYNPNLEPPPEQTLLNGSPRKKASIRLDYIRSAELYAHNKHEADLNIIRRVEKYNRLLVECDKIGQLVRSGDIELCALRHDADMLSLETQIEIEREKGKQLDAEYKMSIEMPAKLESDLIVRIAHAKAERSRIETDARVVGYGLIQSAERDYNNHWRLAEARGLTRFAEAAIQYYNALIIDRLSAYFLDIIAKKCKVDPLFRFKLEKPLKIIKHVGSKNHRAVESNCESPSTSRALSDLAMLDLAQ